MPKGKSQKEKGWFGVFKFLDDWVDELNAEGLKVIRYGLNDF